MTKKDQSNRAGCILIVDDEENVRWFIASACEPFGYEILTASSGYEALKVIQEHQLKLDLVILDLNMPGMGGVEVLKSIRKFQPELPVIVLTAMHEKEAECQALYISGFIKKPYKLEALFRKITSIIERQAFEKGTISIPPDMVPAAKILIVDDEPEVCEILGTALQEDVLNVDFKVAWVTSSEKAIPFSLEFEPDLAIVDIKMPHMWGDDLIKCFERGEGHSPKDFIIYSSISDPSQVTRARSLGYKFLPKPTDLDTVVDVLKKLCIRHQLLRPL